MPTLENSSSKRTCATKNRKRVSLSLYILLEGDLYRAVIFCDAVQMLLLSVEVCSHILSCEVVQICCYILLLLLKMIISMIIIFLFILLIISLMMPVKIITITLIQ